jgi:hypothetical protein
LQAQLEAAWRDQTTTKQKLDEALEAGASKQREAVCVFVVVVVVVVVVDCVGVCEFNVVVVVVVVGNERFGKDKYRSETTIGTTRTRNTFVETSKMCVKSMVVCVDISKLLSRRWWRRVRRRNEPVSERRGARTSYAPN